MYKILNISAKKRGISLIVSYVLLIVIGIAVALIVYTYLKLYLPSQTPECPSDLALAIQDSTCTITNKKLTLTIINKGLFNVSVYFLRFGDVDRDVLQQLNRNQEYFPYPLAPVDNLATSPKEEDEVTLIFNLPSSLSAGKKKIEIQPAIVEKGVFYPCEKAVITQEVDCV